MLSCFVMVSEFLSTPSARRATYDELKEYFKPIISIHALREEGDSLMQEVQSYTPSISIHALREEGDGRPVYCIQVNVISIHALREEGDRKFSPWASKLPNFYPRPPRGGRHGLDFDGILDGLFLSTPSARRAT